MILRARTAILCALLLPFWLGDRDSNASDLPFAKDQVVADLENLAGKCDSAQDALRLYEMFQATHSLTPSQEGLFNKRLKTWQSRAEAGLVKLGVKWVTKSEAEAVGKRADALIEQGFEKIKSKEYKEAKRLLEKARAIDPEGVRADYILGMLNSPNLANYAFDAQKYFAHAVRREPESVPLLNNLALSEVRTGSHADALHHWVTALRLTDWCPEIVQNLGRFMAIAKARTIKCSDAHVLQSTKIYERAITDKKGPAFQAGRGFLYSPLALPPLERDRSTLPHGRQILAGSGTAFLIAPEILLTNEHVVHGVEGIKIVDQDSEHTLRPTVLLKSTDKPPLDLAVLRCVGVTGTPLLFETTPPKRSSDIMVMGYPLTSALGTELKSSRGPVFGLDNSDPGMFLYDVLTNPGNSGGPVLNAHGRVVGVHFAGIDLRAANGKGNLGCGMISPVVLPFIQDYLIDAPDTEVKNLSWEEVDLAANSSVFLVQTYQSEITLAYDKPADVDLFEDQTCPYCRGHAIIPCPVAGCYRGSVSEFESELSIEGVGSGALVVLRRKPKPKSCRSCGGKGYVSCPKCGNGIDPSLGDTIGTGTTPGVP